MKTKPVVADYEASLRRMNRRPSTPGDLLADLMETCGLTQTDVAQRLGVTRQTVHQLLLGRRSLSADMAQRLGRLFGGGPGVWMRMQQQVDLWNALHASPAPYAAIEPLPLAA